MAMTLNDFLIGGAVGFILLFARLGAVLLVLPGIGDSFVPAPVRLAFALALSLVLAPLLAPSLPAPPSAVGPLFLLILWEVATGILIGGVARILISALDVAGTVIAFQTGLSNAFVFNPGLSGQTPITAATLGLVGAVLLFVTDLHHLFIIAMIESYTAFPPGGLPMTGDMAAIVMRLVGQAFGLGVTIAAPLIAVGLVLYIGVGLINRLMPQVQVFFIALPLQIALGLFVFGVTGTAMLLYWLNRVAETYSGFIAGGGL